MAFPPLNEHIASILASIDPAAGRLIIEGFARDADYKINNALLTRLIAQFADLSRELEESQELYRLLAEESTDMISQHTMEGVYTFVSPSCEMLLGYTQEELIGTSSYAYFNEDDLAEIVKSHTNIKMDEATETVQYRIRRKNGTFIWFETTSKVIHNALGQATSIIAASRDITDRKKMEEALRESEEKYRTLVTTMVEGVVMQAADGSIIASNESAERILGLTQEQLAGRTSIDERWHAVREDGTPFPGEEHPAMVTLRTGSALFGVIMGVYKPDGSLTWISINAQPIFFDTTPTPSAVVTTFNDITRQKLREDEIRRISVTDHLTQIYNRMKFVEELNREIPRANRYDAPLSIVMFDIDHFKRVNDTYGHDAGDNVLKTVASLVKDLIRDTDVFARWGGEEFIILLPNTLVSDGKLLAERIRKAIADYEFTSMPPVTASFGITQLQPNDAGDDLTKRVDKALYHSKASGRNRTTSA